MSEQKIDPSRSVARKPTPARRHAWPALLGLALLWLLLPLPAGAQANADRYNVTTWGTRNGLPEMSVQALTFAPHSLFVGTAGGLCLFDGTHCNPLQTRGISKFPAVNLSALLQVRDQSLWAGTQGVGLYHVTSDKVELFDSRSGLTDLYIRALFEDSQGGLWVGTDDGLFKRSGARFERVSLPLPSQEHREVYAIAEDAGHRLILGGDQLTYLSGLDPRAGSVQVPFFYSIRSLLVTREGGLLAGTLGGIYKMQGKTPEKLAFPNVDVERLCQTADGSVWAGTVSSGLWRIEGARATQVPLGGDVSRHSILTMTADPSGRLWVGTETGLSRIERTTVHLIPSLAAAVDSETLSLSAKGAVLLVNNRIYTLNKGAAEPVRSPLPGASRILFNMLTASDHSLWIGTAGNGVFHVDGSGHTTQYSTYSALRIAGNFPRGMVEGQDGEVWVATASGVSRIRRSGPQEFNASNGLPNRNVRSLLQDRDGCMWIGTHGGVAVYCKDRFIENRATRTLGSEEISAITQDTRGTIWLGTRSRGLYSFRGSDLRHFTAANGLPSNFICGLAADRQGTLWISSPEAISSMPFLQPLDDAHHAGLVFARAYPLPEGAEDLRLSADRFPNILVDLHGTVWFATNRGPVYIERPLASYAELSDRPIPVITSLLSDDAFLHVGHAATLVVPPGAKVLTIKFEDLYLGSDQDVLLAYRLEGMDDNWTVSGGNHQVEYRGLSAGTYRFELRAYSRAQPQEWKSASVDFRVPTIWYRSGWFYVTLVLSLAALAFSFHLLNLRRAAGRFKLILEERTRLAREMHDTLIQGCNGVALLLEADASSRPVGSKYLDLAREQLRGTVADAREAVWNLRQSEIDASAFVGMLRQIAAQAQESLGIPVALKKPSPLPRLQASVAHEILMIVREAVTNAGRHASPAAIEISASFAGDQLLVRVADDGTGFDLDATNLATDDHYGIVGMRERAELIEATFEIASQAGKGTSVQVSVRSAISGEVATRHLFPL